ncbi:MAG: hypothetical protein IIB69_02025 [Proteobacteria bacterium]|nr:hypothetical protein [Pseudomonadota bacterium]
MTITAKKIVDPSTVKETLVSVIVREMSISVERFSNRLAQVSGGVVSEEKSSPGRYKLLSSTGSITITCEKMQNRYIGSLTIPVMKVELDFGHYDMTQIESFMKLFDRAYLKLGG